MVLEVEAAAVGSHIQYSFLGLSGYNEDGSCLKAMLDSLGRYTSSSMGEFSYQLPRIGAMLRSSADIHRGG